MNYLLQITPLEPYTFGTDQNSKYTGVKNFERGTYFVRSGKVPEQTTILGMLRYLILEDKKLLRADFSYTDEERKRMSRYIGSDSFCFATDEVQDFGIIQKISPLFILNEKGEYCVKNPFHNRANEGYEPMKMSKQTILTSNGEIRLPQSGEFDAKNGHAGGYYNLSTGEIISEMFMSHVVSGNRKNGKTSENDDDCFYKREMITLKEGHSFAVFVELKEEISEDSPFFVFMGQKKSAFRVTAKRKENDLEKKIECAFRKGSVDSFGESWWYALSDIFAENNIKYDSFAIVDEKRLRNLKTNYRETTQTHRLQRSRVQYNLIQNGSVFYKTCSNIVCNKNLQNVGYNKIIEIGGK